MKSLNLVRRGIFAIGMLHSIVCPAESATKPSPEIMGFDISLSKTQFLARYRDKIESCEMTTNPVAEQAVPFYLCTIKSDQPSVYPYPHGEVHFYNQSIYRFEYKIYAGVPFPELAEKVSQKTGMPVEKRMETEEQQLFSGAKLVSKTCIAESKFRNGILFVSQKMTSPDKQTCETLVAFDVKFVATDIQKALERAGEAKKAQEQAEEEASERKRKEATKNLTL